jgi:hypothetical protein
VLQEARVADHAVEIRRRSLDYGRRSHRSDSPIRGAAKPRSPSRSPLGAVKQLRPSTRPHSEYFDMEGDGGSGERGQGYTVPSYNGGQRSWRSLVDVMIDDANRNGGSSSGCRGGLGSGDDDDDCRPSPEMGRSAT